MFRRYDSYEEYQHERLKREEYRREYEQRESERAKQRERQRQKAIVSSLRLTFVLQKGFFSLSLSLFLGGCDGHRLENMVRMLLDYAELRLLALASVTPQSLLTLIIRKQNKSMYFSCILPVFHPSGSSLLLLTFVSKNRRRPMYTGPIDLEDEFFILFSTALWSEWKMRRCHWMVSSFWQM